MAKAKTKKFIDEINRLLRKKCDGIPNITHITRQMIKMAKDGDKEMIKYIVDRIEGKPKEIVQLDIFAAYPKKEISHDIDKYKLEDKVIEVEAVVQ